MVKEPMLQSLLLVPEAFWQLRLVPVARVATAKLQELGELLVAPATLLAPPQQALTLNLVSGVPLGRLQKPGLAATVALQGLPAQWLLVAIALQGLQGRRPREVVGLSHHEAIGAQQTQIPLWQLLVAIWERQVLGVSGLQLVLVSIAQ